MILAAPLDTPQDRRIRFTKLLFVVTGSVCNGYKPGRDSSNVGSSRRSNSFMTISHTGWLRLGQFWALPLHLCGILKNRVYGQMGTRPREAVMEASYTKNWCSIIWNCLLPPTLRYGARMPTIEPSEMFANLFIKTTGYSTLELDSSNNTLGGEWHRRPSKT